MSSYQIKHFYKSEMKIVVIFNPFQMKHLHRRISFKMVVQLFSILVVFRSISCEKMDDLVTLKGKFRHWLNAILRRETSA